jgi:DNA ligase (NAD+)
VSIAEMIDIDTLVKHLKKASDAYYNGEPTITDAEFDALRDKLEELDPENSFLSDVGAPKPSGGGWPTHKHRTLMGSLAKVKTKEEFDKWASDKGDEFLISEKYDGSTVVATYKDGKLKTLATRGDGTVGENITPNARQIKNVPSDLESGSAPGVGRGFSGEIRGEAILKISLFDKYFRPDGHSNPRNTSNGKVRDMKPDPLKQHIGVLWFDIQPTDRDMKTESEKWKLIAQLGLLYPEHGADPNTSMYVVTAEKAWEIFEQYRDPDEATGTSCRTRLDYEIDGLVVKVNDIDLQESFGVTSNRPKGALAIKFPSIEKETTVTDIVWGRGLTGVISPVAHLAPIEIGGVTIAKASLCGIEEIDRLEVAIGDTVIVSRRNDVIPKIERVVSRVAGRSPCQPPTHCDLCEDTLVREGAYIFCMNEECQGEIYGSLMTWIKELKIKGFGPSMVRSLIEEDVKDIAQLYTSSREVFHRAAGSEKNGDRRYDALHAAGKDLRLSTFLSALNIKALGTTNGQRLERKFKTLDGVLAATDEELQEVPGIKTNAKKIHAGLQKGKVLISALNGLLTIKDLDESGPLAGKSFCITGDLSVPRPKVHDWIKDQGGLVKSGVSKTLDYLVTSDPDSGTGKNKKADKYGVTKISEDELYVIGGSRPSV